MSGPAPARPAKPSLAISWASSCGGCEVSVLNLADKLLMLDKAFQLVFCPCLTDFKHADLRGYPDGSIDLCLFNGAIHSTENEELARLLRRKSRLLVAYGSCAHEGCVPGLANLTTARPLLETVFGGDPPAAPGAMRLPQARSSAPEGDIELPALFDTVRTLDQVVPVDYYLPGCPPESNRVWEVLELFIAALHGREELPPRGAVLGAGRAAVCAECPRTKPSRQVERFHRPHEVTPDEATCLLDQGLVCMGPATRDGCGALCPRVNMGCRGCYGPPEGVRDQGARMISVIAGTLGVGAPEDGEARGGEAIRAAVETVVDPVGTFYRYSLAHSLLRRARIPCGDEGSGSPP